MISTKKHQSGSIQQATQRLLVDKGVPIEYDEILREFILRLPHHHEYLQLVGTTMKTDFAGETYIFDIADPQFANKFHALYVKMKKELE
jgi:hypothetical protein